MHMYFALLVTALSWMESLAPGRNHLELATATVDEVMAAPPLFVRDSSRLRSLALVIAIEFRESSLDNRAVGDNGTSFCAMQVHTSIGGNASLLEDPRACVRAGLRFLQSSVRIDRAHPLAFYARGPRYKSEEAQRISDNRMRLASSLLAQLEQ